MYGRSADTSLAEICLEMSELFDKQVNAQKEINFWGSCKLLKVCDENERNKKK